MVEPGPRVGWRWAVSLYFVWHSKISQQLGGHSSREFILSCLVGDSTRGQTAYQSHPGHRRPGLSTFGED